MIYYLLLFFIISYKVIWGGNLDQHKRVNNTKIFCLKDYFNNTNNNAIKLQCHEFQNKCLRINIPTAQDHDVEDCYWKESILCIKDITAFDVILVNNLKYGAE